MRKCLTCVFIACVLALCAACGNAAVNVPESILALPEDYEGAQYRDAGGGITEITFQFDGCSYNLRIAKGDTDIPVPDEDFSDTSATSVYLSGNVPVYYFEGGAGHVTWLAEGYTLSLYTALCDPKQMERVMASLTEKLHAQSGAASAQAAYEPLWDIDFEQYGYLRTEASYTVSWEGEELTLTYVICPELYAQIPQQAKSVQYEGRDFLLEYQEVCWDAEDSSGTEYTRRLSWRQNGRAYSLTAISGDKNASLDIASPKTALRLEAGELSIEGLEEVSEIWYAGFVNEQRTLRLYLYPPPHGDDWLKALLDEGSVAQNTIDGFTYYRSDDAREPEDPNTAMMIWETDMSWVYLWGGVPYDARNDYSDDVWDFINPDLAEWITQQVTT